ncbi:MAG: ATP-binding cassette domain-containing protein, partial [Microvirgula sp.]
MAGTALVTAMNDNAVTLRGFGKRYGKTVAVDGVDLDIARGEIFGLIGPDGAGKSSLMKAVAGVLTFDSGSIDVFGTRIDSERAAETIKARLGLMPQGLGQNLYGDLSIEENIDFFARLRLVPADVLAERKKTLLGMTRLDRFRNRPMKQLSGGMKQKLGLVCTLIHAPDLVILDEPTTGVDPVSRRDFWTILAELLHEQGITALVSTAYLDEASRFQRMAMLHGGQVLASGTPADIHALSPGAVVTLAGDDQVAALARLKPRFPQSEALGPQLRVFVDDAEPGPAGEQV